MIKKYIDNLNIPDISRDTFGDYSGLQLSSVTETHNSPSKTLPKIFFGKFTVEPTLPLEINCSDVFHNRTLTLFGRTFNSFLVEDLRITYTILGQTFEADLSTYGLYKLTFKSEPTYLGQPSKFKINVYAIETSTRDIIELEFEVNVILGIDCKLFSCEDSLTESLVDTTAIRDSSFIVKINNQTVTAESPQDLINILKARGIVLDFYKPPSTP